MRLKLSLLWAILALSCSESFAQNNTRISTVHYDYATVGTTAQDAIPAADVARLVYGWSVCHAAGSASTYLSASSGADPDVDGVRVGSGDCWHCTNCGGRALTNLNVKGQAAGTGYTIIQYEP